MEIGLDRFVAFLAGWSAEDVQTLGRLLNRLETSIAEVKQREQAPPNAPGERVRDRREALRSAARRLPR